MNLLGRRSPTAADTALYLIGVVGLAASVTLLFLGMRAVMDIGGFCADGGPYVIETHCPDGVPLLMFIAFPGLFLFGGIMLWKGTAIGGWYGGLALLAWPALFLSLGWNFLEYAFKSGDGVVLGWLIPGVMFVLMGGLPLLGVLPLVRLVRGPWRPAGRPPVGYEPPAEGGPRSGPSPRSPALAGADDDPISRLERLAALRAAGALSESEFEAAKRNLIGRPPTTSQPS